MTSFLTVPFHNYGGDALDVRAFVVLPTATLIILTQVTVPVRFSPRGV